MMMPVASLSVNATAVRSQRAGWKRFPLSSFGEQLCSNDVRKKPASLQTLWASHQASMQGEGTATTPNGCFLHLCLELGQLLWQEQCHPWTATKKAWISESRVLSCVRFYMQGQRVGDAPVFDGMCANCGHLLYGPVNSNTASTGNKFTGKPRNIRGSPCISNGQPPFLLRWHPKELQEFAPDVFAWDAATNCLSLREQHQQRPPWKAQPHHRRTDKTELWLYCKACLATTTKEGAIPFRDGLSVPFCRGLDTMSTVSRSSQLPGTVTTHARAWEEATA